MITESTLHYYFKLHNTHGILGIPMYIVMYRKIIFNELGVNLYNIEQII